MVKVKEDLTGWKQWEHDLVDGRLMVLCQTEDYVSPKTGLHAARWLCECNCVEHNKVVASSSQIKSGKVKSCGCLKTDIILHEAEKHHKTNTYKLDGEYGIGYTYKNEEFWFDLEDYDKIKDYCWSYNKYGYLTAWNSKTKKLLRLHRMVMDVAGSTKKVDHKTHLPYRENKFDNRKSNLRIVTQSENNMNKITTSLNTSGTTGVHWDKRDGRWVARISIYGKRINLGSFVSKEDAIKVRKNAELKYFGDYRYSANN